MIERGQIIAAVGLTGMTTGPHLHFVVWRDGELTDPLSVIAHERVYRPLRILVTAATPHTHARMETDIH